MKAVILSSGGTDSTTCVAIALDRGFEVSTVSVKYGQRHSKELEGAAAVADYYGLHHDVIDLTRTGIYEHSRSALFEQGEDVPQGSYAEQQAAGDGPVATYVPFRNGLMLSAISAYALSLNCNEQTTLFIGAHADDAAGDAYPDCREDFLDYMRQAINIGSYGKVTIDYPLAELNKAGVVAEGLRLGAPFQYTWSCYQGGERPCGKCGTCIDRAAAFAANGVPDPAL